MRRHTSFILLIALCIAACFAQSAHAGENSIGLEADKTRMTVGDVLRCTVTVSLGDEDAVSAVTQPNFEGFSIINSSTSTQHSTSIVNFKMTSTKTLITTYLLSPEKPGQYTLGPASFLENGRRVTSNTLRVTVVDLKEVAGEGRVGDQAMSAPMNESERQNDRVFFRMIPERSELYIGEQMAATLYLYTANVGIRDVQQVAPPEFPGFAEQRLELPDNRRSRRVSLEGTTYTVQAVGRHLLTAIAPGDHTLPPYRLQVVLASGGGFFSSSRAYLSTAPVTVTVKPLPLDGRPAGFDEANVGRFRITASLDRRQTEVNQPVTLTLTLEGNTDMDRVQMPEMPPIDGAKVYPPTTKKENYQQGARIVGRRVAEFLISPQQVGTLNIPSVPFTFFGSESNTYKTIETQPFRVRVTPASGAPGASTGLSAPAKQELSIEDGSLRPLKPRASLENVNGQLYGSPLFLALFFGPLALVLLLWLIDLGRFLHPRLFGAEKLKRQRAIRQLTQDLERRAASPDKGFALDLGRLVLMELELTYSRSFGGMTYEQILGVLAERGASQSVRADLMAAFEAIDLIRYAPGTAGNAAELLERVKRLMREVRA